MKKRSIWKKAIAGALAIALMLGAFPAVNCVRVEAAVKLEHTKGKDAKDVAALKKLIAKAPKQGADVSTDLNNSDQYKWKNGKLVGLNWSDRDLTGAWDFSSLKNLTNLYCDTNYRLSKLDVSGCTKLTSLVCSYNKLSKLNVSKCTKLKTLFCVDNKLSKLNVSKCTKLTSLYCSSNKLSKLDVSGCTKLETLYCGSNKLSKLNVSKCTELRSLDCSKNQLNKLDVSGCTKLTFLDCRSNKLKKVTVSDAEDLDDVEVDDGVKIDEIVEEKENVWKKAYIDYFNNKDLSKYTYTLADINSDNMPELFLFLIGASSADESEFYYVNKDNEVKDIALSHIFSFYADNGVLYLTGGRTGYYQDIIYQCNASGDYECVFEGEFEDYVSDGEVSFRYYIGENEISEEEYKKILAVYGDIENMKHFSAEDSNQGDVISAIQNYASEQNAEDSKNADASQISDWKNAYINYFNNLDEQVDSYRLIDINGDNIPEIYYEHRVVYLNNNNEAKVIDSLNQFCSYNSKSICAYDHIGGGDIYVIYGYNNSQGEYELVFEGREYPEINDEGDQIGNIFYINGVEVSPEEYESKFNEVSGNEEYNFLDEESELSYGDIVSAIQNYQ